MSDLRGDPLGVIIDKYLSSDRFNGLPVGAESDRWPGELAELTPLLESGEVQVVSEADFPNPHIRPWRSTRSSQDQASDLEAAASGQVRVCLFPTRTAMEGQLEDSYLVGSPYSRRLAEGSGAFDLAYFELDALESYRNDPRYDFEPWDFGVRVGISEPAYDDPATLDRDKIISVRVGFAYDHDTLVEVEKPVVRRACVFLHDLSSMTPEHQRRWETFEVERSDHGTLRPHPIWYAAQLGHWPDGIGPFQKILAEMDAINQLFSAAFGQLLLRTTDRPERFSWVLRPSTAEWDEFVLTLDKLLGENLVGKALSAARVPTDLSGARLGTISRLRWFLDHKANLPNDYVTEIVSPWREVRAARQSPAHKLRTNVTDLTLVRKQSGVLSDVAESLHRIRHVLASHHANRDWRAPEHLDDRRYVL